MTKKLLMLVVLTLVAYGANAQNPLQDFVVETRGDTLVVADFFAANGTPSTLGAVIQADTDAGNVPEGRVYMLLAGTNGTLQSGNPSMYLFDAGISEQGRPLTIVGEYCGQMAQVRVERSAEEAADCRPPSITGFQDAAGNAALATLSIDDDLTMKDLHFTSAHNQGQADWSMVNVNGDNVVVTWENVLGEHNRWTWINSNANFGTQLYISDSYFINATDQPSRRNGGVYDADTPTDVFFVENTTHVQNQGMQYKFRAQAPSQAIFNHNTWVNAAGQIFLGYGYLTNFAATNNLFVNSNYQPYYPGLDFSESYEDPEVSDFQPHGIINLNYLPVGDDGNTFANTAAAFPETEPFDEADRKILVDLNAAYWDDLLLTIADDLNAAGVEGDVCESDDCVQDMPSLDWTTQAILANERTMDIFNDNATFPLVTWGTWYEAGAPGFADGPGMVQALYDWGYDSANSGITTAEVLPKVREAGNEAGNEIDNEDTNNWIVYDWPVAVDLSYSNQTYMTGGLNGFPLGDLNWFPDMKENWLAQRDAEYAAIQGALDSGSAIGTAIEDIGGEIPSSIQLDQNYPNPFTTAQATQIDFSVPQHDDVQIEVYDILGRRVATLVNQSFAPGNYTVDWDGTNESGNVVSSGVYLYTLRTGDHVATKQMVFLK